MCSQPSCDAPQVPTTNTTMCRVHFNAWQREYRRRNPQITLRMRLRKYGLEIEDYDALLAAQDGVCAICSESETQVRNGSVQMLSVDHCHETGTVRGLLCNHMLGKARDDPEVLRAAAAYIERSSVSL